MCKVCDEFDSTTRVVTTTTIASPANSTVEVPLSWEYLTETGMYKAGYLWGRHIRSVESAPKDAPEIFLRGVEDGYGDGMRIIDERMVEKNKKIEENSARIKAYWNE